MELFVAAFAALRPDSEALKSLNAVLECSYTLDPVERGTLSTVLHVEALHAHDPLLLALSCNLEESVEEEDGGVGDDGGDDGDDWEECEPVACSRQAAGSGASLAFECSACTHGGFEEQADEDPERGEGGNPERGGGEEEGQGKAEGHAEQPDPGGHGEAAEERRSMRLVASTSGAPAAARHHPDGLGSLLVRIDGPQWRKAHRSQDISALIPRSETVELRRSMTAFQEKHGFHPRGEDRVNVKQRPPLNPKNATAQPPGQTEKEDASQKVDGRGGGGGDGGDGAGPGPGLSAAPDDMQRRIVPRSVSCAGDAGSPGLPRARGGVGGLAAAPEWTRQSVSAVNVAALPPLPSPQAASLLPGAFQARGPDAVSSLLEQLRMGLSSMADSTAELAAFEPHPTRLNSNSPGLSRPRTIPMRWGPGRSLGRPPPSDSALSWSADGRLPSGLPSEQLGGRALASSHQGGGAVQLDVRSLGTAPLVAPLLRSSGRASLDVASSSALLDRAHGRVSLDRVAAVAPPPSTPLATLGWAPHGSASLRPRGLIRDTLRDSHNASPVPLSTAEVDGGGSGGSWQASGGTGVGSSGRLAGRLELGSCPGVGGANAEPRLLLNLPSIGTAGPGQQQQGGDSPARQFRGAVGRDGAPDSQAALAAFFSGAACTFNTPPGSGSPGPGRGFRAPPPGGAPPADGESPQQRRGTSTPQRSVAPPHAPGSGTGTASLSPLHTAQVALLPRLEPLMDALSAAQAPARASTSGREEGPQQQWGSKWRDGGGPELQFASAVRTAAVMAHGHPVAKAPAFTGGLPPVGGGASHSSSGCSLRTDSIVGPGPGYGGAALAVWPSGGAAPSRYSERRQCSPVTAAQVRDSRVSALQELRDVQGQHRRSGAGEQVQQQQQQQRRMGTVRSSFSGAASGGESPVMQQMQQAAATIASRAEAGAGLDRWLDRPPECMRVLW